ncbi:MAG: glycoside hydrolase family 3 C-terminal domain-containing protein [Eubacteriales bacterium]|nr:glycoside hydrolase family 3 C-terminal domain-containing protein [Eubacteriales bacterium]
MKRRIRTFSGTLDPKVSEREIANRAVARRAAAQGIVLMKNEGVLPLKAGARVALFGAGATHMVKGGTGSGDVNERDVVNILEGLTNAGVEVTGREWIADYDAAYQKAREDWRDMLMDLAKKEPEHPFFDLYVTHPFYAPAGRAITEEDFAGADTGIYVISRVAGEGADRKEAAGDYYLTEQEKKDLDAMAAVCDRVIVVINAGAQIDVKYILEIPQVKGLVNLGQPGMEGGNALADVLTGKVNPSGKLTDTWAKHYLDFPNARTFSYQSGDITRELYEEGIYVGYRYFDSFEIEPQFPFGFGLSYTTFEIRVEQVWADEQAAHVQVAVENTGACAGREVVQIYAACPQEDIPKEFKRLCGFAKTKELEAGETQTLTIDIPAKQLASFDEQRHAWVLENGVYGLFVGNSSADASVEAVLEVKATVVLEEVAKICPLQEELTELLRPEDRCEEFTKKWKSEAAAKQVIPVSFMPLPLSKVRIAPDIFDSMAAEQVEKLSDEELIAMVIGEVSRGHDVALGAAGIMVPGAAGETSGVLEETYDIPAIAMTDGPAGLRLSQDYEADQKENTVYIKGIWGALEGGFFCQEERHEGADVFYQYCTAIPVGAQLAQTWDAELIEEVGHAIGVEMQEFGVAWWLAPGMNIHRNPLCGRNFEYYSEDPLVSGVMAAAMTRGVQSCAGVGTTIKHYACNNQEDNRFGSNSIVSERVLRELYLRGFEIAVKASQPMAIMTSYNLINGVHSANNYDLCTTVARGEWDFQGIIMTDWTTTGPFGGSTPWKCAAAGNDLIMPGCDEDSENIRAALADGSLNREDLKACVRRMLRLIYQTLGYEDCASYGAKFDRA